jgi:hypothetical protein
MRQPLESPLRFGTALHVPDTIPFFFGRELMSFATSTDELRGAQFFRVNAAIAGAGKNIEEYASVLTLIQYRLGRRIWVRRGNQSPFAA